MFEIVYDDDGRRTTDDGRRLDGYTISSPCEPNGSGELIKVTNNVLHVSTLELLEWFFVMLQTVTVYN